MPSTTYDGLKIHYECLENPGAPWVVLVNGLTQNTAHWKDYMETFHQAGLQTLSFDLLGQGQSDRPTQRLTMAHMTAQIEAVLDAAGVERCFLVGLSFGATLALRYTVARCERVLGLVSMGGASEKDQLFKMLHRSLKDAVQKGGIEYMFDLLASLNFSHLWLKENERPLRTAKMFCCMNNHAEVVENFLDLIIDSDDFTEKLHHIQCPTLVMCGENDVFTPRWCQEILRHNIRHSRLIVVQHICHAFTIEAPKTSKRLILEFIEQVRAGEWPGDQTAWIASDQLDEGFKLYPCKRKQLRTMNL